MSGQGNSDVLPMTDEQEFFPTIQVKLGTCIDIIAIQCYRFAQFCGIFSLIWGISVFAILTTDAIRYLEQ